MTEKETKELTVRAKAGDKAALEELYREYSGRVKKFIMKQGLSEQDADDVLSDSFVEVMKHIGELENEEYFSTWLHRIARRKAVEFKEKQTRHQRVIFDTDDGTNGSDAAVEAAFEAEYGDTVMLPTDYAENEELKAIIAEQINSLGTEQREALFLFYYQNKSINEIAEMTGTNVNNVKARLFNARKSLKKKLEALQKNGVTLCAVPISKLLAELDEGSKGAAAAVSGESAASAEAAEVTSSAGAKIAAVAAAAVIVIGVGFGVSRLSHFKGDQHPEDSSEAMTTTVTTTTTAAVTTAVPEIVDESAEESLTVTTTTTTTTTTTEATTEPPEEPAGGTTEAVIAPPAAEPEEEEPTEHDRWVDSIKEDYTYTSYSWAEPQTLTVNFKDAYAQGLGDAYADGCGYMFVNVGFAGCLYDAYDLVETKDGGKSWVVRESYKYLTKSFRGICLDNGSMIWIYPGLDGINSHIRMGAVSTFGGVVNLTGSGEQWLNGLPFTDGTTYNYPVNGTPSHYINADLEYLGDMDFKLVVFNSVKNHMDDQGQIMDGIDPDTFEPEILFNGIVTLDPATLNIKYYKTLPLEDE